MLRHPPHKCQSSKQKKNCHIPTHPDPSEHQNSLMTLMLFNVLFWNFKRPGTITTQSQQMLSNGKAQSLKGPLVFRVLTRVPFSEADDIDLDLHVFGNCMLYLLETKEH